MAYLLKSNLRESHVQSYSNKENNLTLRSIGLWRWYVNITITILNIIHRPLFYLKHDISETGSHLRFRLERTHLWPIDRATIYLRTGDRIQSPKSCVLNKRTKVNVQNCDSYIPVVFNNGTSSEKQRMTYKFAVFLSHSDCLLLHMVLIVAIIEFKQNSTPIIMLLYKHRPLNSLLFHVLQKERSSGLM
jgi:hypothetical protein